MGRHPQPKPPPHPLRNLVIYPCTHCPSPPHTLCTISASTLAPTAQAPHAPSARPRHLPLHPQPKPPTHPLRDLGIYASIQRWVLHHPAARHQPVDGRPPCPGVQLVKDARIVLRRRVVGGGWGGVGARRAQHSVPSTAHPSPPRSPMWWWERGGGSPRLHHPTGRAGQGGEHQGEGGQGEHQGEGRESWAPVTRAVRRCSRRLQRCNAQQRYMGAGGGVLKVHYRVLRCAPQVQPNANWWLERWSGWTQKSLLWRPPQNRPSHPPLGSTGGEKFSTSACLGGTPCPLIHHSTHP